jgi:hypothetical protein
MSGELNTAWAGVVLLTSLATKGRPNRPRAGGPSSLSWQCVFEAAMKALHHTVGLRVVSCRLGVLVIKQVAQGVPQGGGELGTAV